MPDLARYSLPYQWYGLLYVQRVWTHFIRDEDPDPIGSVDFLPAGSGSGIFFIGSRLHKMIVYNIKIYTYLPKIEYIFSSFRFKVGSGFFSSAEPDPWKKKCRILIPAFYVVGYYIKYFPLTIS